ncbi:antibiotic biosynthesis monooxygenase family protein [Streptomyces sp. NBC_01296]|uniref:antibiotic biosynthesis monooxygenase family protein n=1 Tax=Streptomyces sp. NBC_01296 TaxID=2903816 RepID=UPI002E12BF75|nr:antibiotic biosynthesis monooxygenase [Streptomyces sp. NBC_01296]
MTENSTQEPRPVPASLREFAAGDESDLNVVAPWTGPAVDAETGLLKEPIRGRHLIATSVGWPKPGHEDAAIALNEAILGELYVRPGLLAVTLAISANNFSSTRSLSIWENEAALKGFLKSEPHMVAARRVRELMYDWEGANWVSEETTELPTFDEAKARLDAVRPPGPSDFESYDDAATA